MTPSNFDFSGSNAKTKAFQKLIMQFKQVEQGRSNWWGAGSKRMINLQLLLSCSRFSGILSRSIVADRKQCNIKIKKVTIFNIQVMQTLNQHVTFLLHYAISLSILHQILKILCRPFYILGFPSHQSYK